MNIAILGNTGAGKTTFIRNIIKRFNKCIEDNDRLIFESKYNVIGDTYDSVLLEEFYSNPYHNGYKNQLDKLLKSIRDIAMINHGRKSNHVLLDRSFLDVYVFTEALNNMGMLGKPEWGENDYQILKKYVDLTIELFLDEIDLVIFIKSEFDILLKNITNRGRTQEIANIHRDDLYGLGIQLNSEMDKLVIKLKEKKVKVITLENISQFKINSEEYIKRLDLINDIVDLM